MYMEVKGYANKDIFFSLGLLKRTFFTIFHVTVQRSATVVKFPFVS